MRGRGWTFCIGALGYGGVELAWRGGTHWTMLLAGGLGLLLVEAISDRLPLLPLAAQAAAAAGAITGLELAVGLVCNRLLAWQVWDYSAQWGNLWGQVCLKYALLWVVLAGTAIVLFDWMRHWLFHEERPHYRWI